MGGVAFTIGSTDYLLSPMGKEGDNVTVLDINESVELLLQDGFVSVVGTPTTLYPSLNGGSGEPQVIAAAVGIELTNITTENFVWVNGGGCCPQIVTATPSVTPPTADGQLLYIIATDSNSPVTLQDALLLPGSGLRLNGKWVGAQYSQIILASNMETQEWFEVSRR